MTVIYFDLDGTLLTYDKNFKNIFEEGLGFEVEKEVFKFWSNEIIDNLESMIEDPYLEALKSLNSKFDLGLDVESVRRSYIEAELDATVKNQELIELFKESSDNHSVGILTNGDGVMQRRKIEKHNLDGFARSVIISNLEGVRKPSPEIFELAKEKLSGEKHIYIGDTFEEDIKPARENGFKAIHVENKNKQEQPESVRDLAREVDRDPGQVSKDLKLLYESELIKFKEEKGSKSPRIRHKNIFPEPIIAEK